MQNWLNIPPLLEHVIRIQEAVESARVRNGGCNVLLTGGRAAAAIYQVWAKTSRFKALRDTDFYFGDERCVSPDHPDSNYRMAMQTLFRDGVPGNCRVRRIKAELGDSAAAAEQYALELPGRIDVLLLGVGEDGHIASLFPQSSALHESESRVVAVIGNKPPPRRITITPPVIVSADATFVFALDEMKARILDEARTCPHDIDALPARLVLGATWLMGNSSLRASEK